MLAAKLKKRVREMLPSIETVGILGIFIGIAIIFQLFSSSFLTKGNIFDILREASKLSIISLGLGIVVAGGGIDLSIGHIAGLSGLTTAILLANYQKGTGLAIICGILIGALFGLFNGLVTAQLGISSFITTLGTQFIILGIRYWVTGGATIMFLPDSFTIIGNGKILSIPISIIIMVVMVILCFLLMECTVFGRRVSGTGGNIAASWLSGINVRKYTALTFVISGIFSAFSGIILTANLGLANVDLGDGFLLDALTVAVFSAVTFGRMKTFGIVLVTILFIMLTNGLTMIGVSPSVLNFVKGSLLLSAIAVRKLLQRVQHTRPA